MDKQKVIIGASVSAVAVIVVALIYVLASGPTCVLVKEKPAVQAVDVKPIASSDNKNLARFAANLQYRFDDKEKKDETFLGLNLASIIYGEKAQYDLTLSADCATINVDTSTDKGVTTVNNIFVDLKVPNGKLTSCSIVQPGITFNAATEHYKCEKELQYNCVSSDPSNKGIVAYLNINVLEFEIGGDPETHKKGTFVTKAKGC